jgi:hypothetical protein
MKTYRETYQIAIPLKYFTLPLVSSGWYELSVLRAGFNLTADKRRLRRRKGLQIIYNSCNHMFHDWDIKIEQYTQI